jgi:hypothetical protein
LRVVSTSLTFISYMITSLSTMLPAELIDGKSKVVFDLNLQVLASGRQFNARDQTCSTTLPSANIGSLAPNPRTSVP